MSAGGLIEIPARRGKATRLRQGQSVRVVNTHGQQVVDTWAFRQGAFPEGDLAEFMSMEHSRVAIGQIIPGIGDTLVTNRRRPRLVAARRFAHSKDRFRPNIFLRLLFHLQPHVGVQLDIEIDGDGFLRRLDPNGRCAGNRGGKHRQDGQLRKQPPPGARIAAK